MNDLTFNQMWNRERLKALGRLTGTVGVKLGVLGKEENSTFCLEDERFRWFKQLEECEQSLTTITELVKITRIAIRTDPNEAIQTNLT